MMRKNKMVFLFYIGIVLMILLSLVNTGQSDTRALEGTLESVYVTTPPIVDGSESDAAWTNATAITTSNGVEIKSVHTSTTIYFLATWGDTSRSDFRKQWSFDTTTKEWNQAGRGEDRLAFTWNIGNSVPNFNELGCIDLCHEAKYMSTGATGEEIDTWHWKATRSNPSGWMDDKRFIDTEDPETPDKSRPGDAKTSGGYKDNLQTLNNSVEEVNVPKYYEPDATGADVESLLQSEIDNGEAILITGVDANLTLSYDGGIVPVTATMPGYSQSVPVGSRGDISAKGEFSNNMWTLEIMRALDTTNADDVKFTTGSTDEFFFSVATFDNADGVGHKTDIGPYKLVFFKDSDGDGVGDGADAFPNNAAETKDSDSDGVGDNADKFPTNSNETVDADTDGVGDNADKFDDDAAASKDSDGDGYPDEWNTGKSASDSTTNLSIDEFPDDATKWAKDVEDDDDDDDDEDGDNNLMLIIVIIVVVVVVLVLVMAMGKKKKPEGGSEESTKEDK